MNTEILVDSSFAKLKAIQIAQQFTGRSKVLSLLPQNELPILEHGTIEPVEPLKASVLCRAIAESDKRIAAVLLGPLQTNPLIMKRFAKRVRELTSAEGALLIWDLSSQSYAGADWDISPDLICEPTTDLNGLVKICGRKDIFTELQS